MPITARGLCLKVSIRICFKVPGEAAYSDRPASPVVVINTLPVRLYVAIRSVAGFKLLG